jgi:hypothetical protein
MRHSSHFKRSDRVSMGILLFVMIQAKTIQNRPLARQQAGPFAWKCSAAALPDLGDIAATFAKRLVA